MQKDEMGLQKMMYLRNELQRTLKKMLSCWRIFEFLLMLHAWAHTERGSNFTQYLWVFYSNFKWISLNFKENFTQLLRELGTFYRKIMRKYGINFWETARGEKLRRNLKKFRNVLKTVSEKFWNSVKKCEQKTSCVEMDFFFKFFEVLEPPFRTPMTIASVYWYHRVPCNNPQQNVSSSFSETSFKNFPSS